MVIYNPPSVAILDKSQAEASRSISRTDGAFSLGSLPAPKASASARSGQRAATAEPLYKGTVTIREGAAAGAPRCLLALYCFDLVAFRFRAASMLESTVSTER